MNRKLYYIWYWIGSPDVHTVTIFINNRQTIALVINIFHSIILFGWYIKIKNKKVYDNTSLETRKL